MGRRKLYPECSPTAGSPPLLCSPPVLGLRPRRPRADLKVPLSSRSSGGASVRCLLWDMARRDGWAQRSRAVGIWVLPLHVGQIPRGACLPCCLAPPPIAARLSTEEGQAERGGEAGLRRGRAGHTPSLPGLPATPLSAMLRPSLVLFLFFFFFSATALGAFPASQSLLFPAATRALVGFPELLNAGPQVPPSLPVPDLPSF